MSRFYRVIHAIARVLFFIFIPCKVSGLENLPKDKPAVLCANHTSAIDPFVVCAALPARYPVRIMGKKELFEKPVLGWFLTKLGGFPVDRGHSDLNAVKTALKAVRDGQTLLIFPEGTRVEREGDTSAKGGVVMIAMRTGAPLVPVYAGTKKWVFRRQRIVFGEPLEPKSASRRPTAEELKTYADEVMRRAYALGKRA